MLAESLKMNDSIVISGRKIAGRYMSRPAILRASAFVIERLLLLLIVLPQRGQTRECPTGASVCGKRISQSGQAVRLSKYLVSGCNADL